VKKTDPLLLYGDGGRLCKGLTVWQQESMRQRG